MEACEKCQVQGLPRARMQPLCCGHAPALQRCFLGRRRGVRAPSLCYLGPCLEAETGCDRQCHRLDGDKARTRIDLPEAVPAASVHTQRTQAARDTQWTRLCGQPVSHWSGCIWKTPHLNGQAAGVPVGLGRVTCQLDELSSSPG